MKLYREGRELGWPREFSCFGASEMDDQGLLGAWYTGLVQVRGDNPDEAPIVGLFETWAKSATWEETI